jgi:hypothetical protein
MPMPAPSTPPIVSIGQLTHSLLEEARPPPRTRSPLVEEPAKQRFVDPEKDAFRNIRCQRTSIILDSECESSSTNRNILVYVQSLASFIESNFICKRCHITLKRCREPPLRLEVFGIACSINFNCECRVAASLRPDIMPPAQQKLKL